jgi:hypothetical protein
MSGPILVGVFELQHDLAIAIALESFVGNRRAGDVAAHMFELVALIDGEPHLGMEAKALCADAAW